MVLSHRSGFFNEPMRRNNQKGTIAEGNWVSDDPHWKTSLDELEKFIGFIIALRIIGGQNCPSSVYGIGCTMRLV